MTDLMKGTVLGFIAVLLIAYAQAQTTKQYSNSCCCKQSDGVQ